MTKKIIVTSIIATSAVFLLGLAITIPIFFIGTQPKVILEFENPEIGNESILCSQISNYLSEEGIKAVVFVSGKFAENNSNCQVFSNSNLDIGSQTYNYIALPQIYDYSVQLEEVKKGKEAVNQAAKLDTKLFKAPYGETNEDIFSLLSRNNIEVDFSYKDHYNKFYDEKFLRFELITVNSEELDNFDFSKMDRDIPTVVVFPKSVTLNDVKETVEILKENNVKFTNPSEITRISLTVRNT